ncbi:MAG: pyrrolo-quinoline quinone [Planctomycetota bacterium]|nr:MAG: pyrrolo-quinoline quinone [Planctomycetota bacterium]
MTTWNRVVVGSVCWALLSGVAMAQRQTADKVLPTQQQLSRFGLERAWWGQATLNPSRDKVRHVTVDEDIVYIQASSGSTTAFNSETGERLWAIQLGRFDQPSFAAVSNEDLALFVVGSTMYGIEKATGKTAWTLTLPGQPSTGPSVDDNQVYVGTLDGSVYAFSLRKIRRLYQEQRLPQWSHEALAWRYQAGKEVTSPPIATGRTVNFASRDGSLYSVSAADRKLVYQMETDKPIVAPLVRSGKLQFLASEDFKFYAINIVEPTTNKDKDKDKDNGKDNVNGTVKWEFTSGLPIRRAPVVVANDLFLMPDRDGMYCLNASTGALRWRQPYLIRFLAIAGDAMYASDEDGNLIKTNKATGVIAGSYPLRAFSVKVSNDRTDRIYMATESGLIIAPRQKGESLPTFHKFPDRLPILPLVEPEEGTTEEAKPADEAKPAAEAATDDNATN